MANKVLWGGVKLSAEEALQLRLVQEVLAPGDLLPTALSRCESLAALPSDSLELQRRIVKEGLVAKLKEVNLEECEVLEKKWVSKECFSALATYLSSRNMHLAAFLLRYVDCYSIFSRIIKPIEPLMLQDFSGVNQAADNFEILFFGDSVSINIRRFTN